VDEERLRSDFLLCLSQSFNLSFNSCFPTSQNIDALLQNALAQGRNLAINGGIYSEASSGVLLAQAAMLGSALESKVGDLGSKPAEAAGASTAAQSAETK
ncbi:MAG: hypothetical protein N3G22_04175, partial [Candidatus Micrarchaeota archaeon]|nr:hypothetical protein [Candidatus Micrarchaeota archaeon]